MLVISRTPLRVSFAGGGSDLKAYYSTGNPGLVASGTINKYIYITVNTRFDDNIKVKYSRTELAPTVEDIQHEIVRECLLRTGILSGIEITALADVPSSGTGLGSSSAFTVGLLNAIYAYKGVAKLAHELAKEACDVEIGALGKPIGKQDQYAVACGGFNMIQFNPDETVWVRPIVWPIGWFPTFQESVMLFYTGKARCTDTVLTEMSHAIEMSEKVRESTRRMTCLARSFEEHANYKNITKAGECVEKGWSLKRELASGITDDEIDAWHDIALQHGAYGAKLLGAGGGGFMLVISKPEDRASIIEAMPLRHVPVSFVDHGTNIIYSEVR